MLVPEFGEPRPVAGVQVYVVPAGVLSHFARITVQVPEQIVTLLLIHSTGFGLTYTVAVAVALVQPFFVPCTVYTVVLPGDTVMQPLEIPPGFQV